MEVVISSLTIPDLDEVQRRGTSHPTVGRLLHGGSYCPVDGVAATAAGMQEILQAARAAAADAGVPLAEVAGSDSLPSGRDGLVLLGSDPAPADLERIGERAALCLVLADETARSRPMVVLYGRSLPALGAIPACTLQDLQSTWISLAGGTPKGGRHLLHEQAEAWDPQIERQLTERLRQIYGE